MFFCRRPWQLILPFSLLLTSPAFAQESDANTTGEDAPVIQEQPGLQPEAPSMQEGDPEQNDTAPTIQQDPQPEITPDPVAAPAPAVSASNDFGQEVQDIEAAPIAVFAPAHSAPVQTPDLTMRGNSGTLLDRWNVTLGGYLRTAYSMIEDDPNLQLVGRNDGFHFVDARLSLAGQMDNGLGFFFELNADAELSVDEEYAPADKLGARLADAYAYYRPFSFLEFNIGQFKAPFDREELISNASLLFVHRSVGNKGVSSIEGRRAEGLGISRELGLQLRGRYNFLADNNEPNGPGVSYAAAITNGEPENISINSNGKMAYYGRLGLHWGQSIHLGAAYFLNDNTFGEEPNRIKQETSGWTADLLINMYGASLFANVMQRDSSSPDIPNSPEIKSLAYQVQIAYEEPFFGFQPAYRLAYLDPTSDYGDGDTFDIFEQDALTYHTIGLNYNAPGYPVRVMANYTFTGEQDQRELKNDRFDILFQLSW